MHRKITTLLFMATLFFVILLNNGSVLADTDMDDVTGTEYEKPVAVLDALGIIQLDEDNAFRPDDSITRAEMAEIVTRLKITEEQIDSAQPTTFFKDVESDHWASTYIGLASSLGIISGFENGEFRPEESITYEQAIKMLVSLLGYGEYANNRGGYPMGYILLATEKKIIQGEEYTIGAEVSRGDIARLVYNSLEVDMLVQSSFSKDKLAYNISKGKNILNSNLYVSKRSGVVNANSNISIYPGIVNLKQDEVQIGGYKYKVGLTNASNMLGHKVTLYASEKDDNESTLLIVIQDDENFIELSTDNIYEVENVRKSNAKIKYEDDNKKIIDLDLFMYATFIYNGRPLDENEVNNDSIKNACGKVELFDTDDDGKYDLIIISDYKSYVVDSVDVTGKIIYTKYNGPQIELNSQGKDVDYNVFKVDKFVELIEIKEWDVVNILQSKDNTYINININSDSKIRGAVKELSIEELEVAIDSNIYKVSKSYANQIELNVKGIFYLNQNMQIIAFESSADSINYAYLFDSGVSKNGLKIVAELQLLYNNETKIYDLADKVAFNGKENCTGEYVISQLESEGKTRMQPVIIEFDSDNKIKTIHNSDTEDVKYRNDLSLFRKSQDVIYRPFDSHTFRGYFAINRNTVVINIPSDTEKIEEYSIKMDAALYFNSMGYNKYYNVEAYGVDEAGLAKLIINNLGSGVAGVDEKSTLVLVEKVTRSLDEDGNDKYKIYGIFNSKPFSKLVKDTDNLNRDISKLRAGDIIQVNQSSTAIDAVRLIFTPYNDPMEGFLLPSVDNFLGEIGDDKEIGYGTIIGRNGSYIRVKVGTEIRTFPIPKVFFTCRISDRKFIKGQTGDIQVGANVLYKSIYDFMQDLIVYKEF